QWQTPSKHPSNESCRYNSRMGRARQKTHIASRRSAAPVPDPSKSLQYFPIALLAALSTAVMATVLATHWPALSAKAISFDDDQYLTQNLLVQNPSLSNAGRFMREVMRPSTVAGYY